MGSPESRNSLSKLFFSNEKWPGGVLGHEIVELRRRGKSWCFSSKDLRRKSNRAEVCKEYLDYTVTVKPMKTDEVNMRVDSTLKIKSDFL